MERTLIPIDRDLKIRLLEALKAGYINIIKFPEFTEVQPQFDLECLTPEEQALLLKIGEKVLNESQDKPNYQRG